MKLFLTPKWEKLNTYCDHQQHFYVVGLLIAGEIPGNFNQVLYSAVDYNVIWLDEDSAIEYDCGKPFFEEYCIHFMSRTPMLHPEKFEAMMNFTSEYTH